MTRLALVVEAESDGPAVAKLVARTLNHIPEAAGVVFLDDRAIEVGQIAKVSGDNQPAWLRHLGDATKRKNLGGVLAVLDGDDKAFEGQPFCPVTAARTLAARGRAAGAGVLFSLAVVVLSQEFESLLIAAADQLPGYIPPAKNNPYPTPTDPEAAPRGAKRWLKHRLEGDYKESADQLRLTPAVTDWSPVRDRMRSFRRLEHAVAELVAAGGPPVATPGPPPAEAA